MNSFTDLGLARPILQALTNEGHANPTPIQEKAIPIVLAGGDLVGFAQTGTGKTAAFALPILHRLAISPDRGTKPRHCRVLVLSPTRELAQQLRERFEAYGRHMPVRTAIAVGGLPIRSQTRALAEGVDVLIATPGRLIDLIGANAVRLSEVEVLVLDEADRMLDMGFIDPIRRITKRLPNDRQTLFFSATMPRAITKLAKDFLTDPVTVAVTPVATSADRIAQHVLFVSTDEKLSALTHLLNAPSADRALVFARTKRGADKIVRRLAGGGIAANAIHGNKSQPQRQRALNGFRQGDTRVLVATDIAARGIDIPAVSHVINFDVPSEPESYVHRIGRTARAGASGIAISLCSDDERKYIKAIERLIRDTIPEMASFRSKPGKAPSRANHTVRAPRRRNRVGRHS